jgi:selenocysteine lyase/cysteine desulfurase
MTRLRQEAREIIARETNAGDDCSVIFSGSGATSAVNRLVALCGIVDAVKNGAQPVVFIGPYEHHSNILPWRESGAEIIEIDEAPSGGPDLAMLEEELKAHEDRTLLIGSFSAASNVSGIITDALPATRLLKSHGALAFWDYAGGAPYLPIDMSPHKDATIDAIFLSPHKFPGGPGASGVLIVRNSMVRTSRPTWPDGGSVSYVSPWSHDYFPSIIEREEAGTPNLIGDIRAALVFLVKAAIGTDFIRARDKELGERALEVWGNNPRLQLLGVEKPHRLPIFSILVNDGHGGHVHHQLFTRMLSDITGIQARGGCVCAGPYGHRLLNVGQEESERIRKTVREGHEIAKPGWTRLNFSYLIDDLTANSIIEGVDMLARQSAKYIEHYRGNERTSQFSIKNEDALQNYG